MQHLLLFLAISLTPNVEISQDQGAKSAPMMDVNPDSKELRAELLLLMRAGISVDAPNHGIFKNKEGGSLFDGSYDWHSCVIAHWCLLITARTETDEELESWLMERLDTESLRREVELIEQRKLKYSPTFPYDEAWFLMLLSERAKHPNPPALIGEWRAQFEERLLSALEARPFPERGERGFSGAYDSWLNSYLLLLWSEPTSEGVRARLRARPRARRAAARRTRPSTRPSMNSCPPGCAAASTS